MITKRTKGRHFTEDLLWVVRDGAICMDFRPLKPLGFVAHNRNDLQHFANHCRTPLNCLTCQRFLRLILSASIRLLMGPNG